MKAAAQSALKTNLVPLAITLAVAAALHFAIAPQVGPFASKLLTDIGINIVLAVSLNIVNGFTGQFSLGHAGFMAIGGYTAGIITYYGGFALFGSTAQQLGAFSPGEFLFVAGCIAGALAAAAFGFAVGLPSLRLKGDYLAIVTLGFGEILRVTLQRTGDVMFLPDDIANASTLTRITSVGGSLGFTGIPFYTNLFWVTLFAGITLATAYRLKYSTFGRAFLAIREDELAAEAMGVQTTRLKVLAFVISAFFAGLAGALFAHEVGTTLNPRELGFQKSIDIVIMVVLGGMGSISGSVMAAAVLTLLPEGLRAFADYRMVVYALALIGLMVLRPQGIFGTREIWETRPFAAWMRRRRLPESPGKGGSP